MDEDVPVIGEGADEPPVDANQYKSLQAKARKLEDELRQSREIHRQAEPVIKLAQALWNAPGGREIIANLRAGKPLTEKQAARVEAVADAGGKATAGLTADEVRGIVQDSLTGFRQQSWEERKAEKEIEALHKRASKDLEGYEELAGTKQWNDALNTTLALIEQRSLIPPEEEDDPIYWAVKHTFKVLTGLGPGEKKEKPAGRNEQERRGAIAAQAGRPAGSPDTGKEPSTNQAWASARGRSTVGKSFSSPRPGRAAR